MVQEFPSPFPAEKIPLLSRKNCLFSGKEISNSVKFIISLSTSAWAKSVLIVASRIVLEVIAHFKSLPGFSFDELLI